MLYIALWVFNFLCLLTLEKSNYKGRLFFVLLFISLAATSTLRGMVGTDTHSYEHIVEEYLNQIGKLNWEPLFGTLFYSLADLTHSPTLTVRLTSLTFCLIFFYYFSRATRDEVFVFAIYILPVFYFNYSMNALRLGLGSAFLLYAARHLGQQKNVSFFKFGALAVLSHYSHIISVFYLYFINQKTAIKWYIFSILLLPLLVFFIYYFKSQYFSDKLNLYLSFSSPSFFSGAPKALVCVVLIFSGLTSSINRKFRIRFTLLSLLGTLAAYSLVFISYAGLRFLDLMSYLIPLALLSLQTKENIALTKSSKWLIAIASFISLLFLYRSFLIEEHTSISPFLPYEFLFRIL